MNWAKIEGYPYVIHPCGTVLRIWNNHTRELKPIKNNYGYLQVCLNNNGKKKRVLLHRLLGLHFIPNPENKPQIDHINGVKYDNRLENLRWVTISENQRGFRKDRGVFKDITKGGIYKRENSWRWAYCIKGKKKEKQMKSKEDLQKFRKKKLSQYNL